MSRESGFSPSESADPETKEIRGSGNPEGREGKELRAWLRDKATDSLIKFLDLIVSISERLQKAEDPSHSRGSDKMDPFVLKGQDLFVRLMMSLEDSGPDSGMDSRLAMLAAELSLPEGALQRNRMRELAAWSSEADRTAKALEDRRSRIAEIKSRLNDSTPEGEYGRLRRELEKQEFRLGADEYLAANARSRVEYAAEDIRRLDSGKDQEPLAA